MIKSGSLLLFTAIILSGLSAFAEQIDIDWIEIKGGCFQIGNERYYPEETPVRSVCVDRFQISKTEITNAQFALFVEQTGYITRAERGWSAEHPNGPGIDVPPGSAVFISPKKVNFRTMNWWKFVEDAHWRSPAGPNGSVSIADHPVVHVTREDAEAFAAWARARMPSEHEWEFAANGPTQAKPQRPKNGAAPRAPESANTWQGVFPVIDTADDGFSGIAPVASFPPNARGLHDMLGNVWEWTASPYLPNHILSQHEDTSPAGFDPHQPDIPVGVIKGGSYLCAPNFCYRFRSAARQAQDISFGTSHIGFRIARDP